MDISSIMSVDIKCRLRPPSVAVRDCRGLPSIGKLAAVRDFTLAVRGFAEGLRELASRRCRSWTLLLSLRRVFTLRGLLLPEFDAALCVPELDNISRTDDPC